MTLSYLEEYGSCDICQRLMAEFARLSRVRALPFWHSTVEKLAWEALVKVEALFALGATLQDVKFA